MFLIPEAFAQAATTGGAAATQPGMDSLLPQFLPMVAIFAVFYFLMIRPQMKQQKLKRQMVAKARGGDEIVTTSGLHGKIVSVDGDNAVNVQIAKDVVVKMERSHIDAIKGYDPKAA